MRRFELSEGTSNKFWQIELAGSQFTVTWGRIGTAGQTQTKSFDTDDKARAEHDKLVAEKVKKGYGEVASAGGAAAPAPAKAPTPKAPPAPKPAAPAPAAPAQAAPVQPAPTPVAAPAAAPAPAVAKPLVSRAARIDWTPEALRHVAPSRLHNIVTAKQPTAAAAWSRLRQGVDKANLPTLLQRGIAKHGDPGGHVARLLTWLQQETAPTSLNPDHEELAWLLIGPRTSYGDADRHGDLIALWCSIEGPTFALEQLARPQRWFVHSEQVPGTHDLNLLNLSGTPQTTAIPWWRESLVHDCWRQLRTAVLAAGESQRPTLQAHAERLRAGMPLSHRALVAVAFEEHAWAKEAIAAWQAAGTKSNDLTELLGPLLLLEPDPAALQAALVATGRSDWELIHTMEPMRHDLLARFGVDAAPTISWLTTKASGADSLRTWAGTLALCVAEEVGVLFISGLESKELRAIGSEWLVEHAELTLAQVAARAAGKGAGQEAALMVLKLQVAKLGDALAPLLESLPPASRASVERLQAASATAPEASEAELPELLRVLPWNRKVVAAEPEPLTLKRPASTPLVHWRPGERERADPVANRWQQPEPEKRDQLLARAVQIEKGEPVSRYESHPRLFANLPAADGGVAFNRANHAVWDWSYGEIPTLLLARCGIAVLPGLLALAAHNLAAAFPALVHVESPEVATTMARAFATTRKLRGEASEWLVRHAATASLGLIPAAVGEPDPTRDHARSALRFMATQGRTSQIESAALSFGEEALAATRAVLAFDPLRVLPKRMPKLPAFFAPRAFTRPHLLGRERSLPESSVEALGQMLAIGTLDAPYAGVAQLAALCDPRSLADFAWDLFQAWLTAGAPSKEGWAFTALGLLGNDETARRLTPLVRIWPGEAAHARAVTGLEVLASIGTDVALMHLHGIAQKLKFKGLQEKAREKIDAIAERRGLTGEELADRLVPDLGLDEDGSLWLDFGPRRFRVVFDEALVPAVVDETGKRLPDLPKARATDEAEKAQAATDTWKALKKDARTLSKIQLQRLEQAMCSQRRWSAEVFRSFLLGHPLLVHLVRRLVWSVHGADDAVIATFRVAEDSSLATSTDDAWELPEGAQVGIAHRLTLGEALAGAWGQLFGDYELLQPFEQLSRSFRERRAGDGAAVKLDTVKGQKLPTTKVLGLDARGWRRGLPQDGGVVCWYEKPTESGTVLLDLEPGIFTGMVGEAPEQTLGELTLRLDANSWGAEGLLPFGRLSAVAWSELMRDLESLRS